MFYMRNLENDDHNIKDTLPGLGNANYIEKD